jgi:hypothetical protein
MIYILYIHPIFFIYLCFYGQLGWIYILDIVNNVQNLGDQISLKQHSNFIHLKVYTTVG